MKVSFTNTVKDMVELNMQAKPSSGSERVKIFFIALIPLIVIIGFIYDYYCLGLGFSYWYVAEFIFCILWVIFFPMLGNLSAKLFLTFRLRKTAFHPLTIELSDEGITKYSNSSSSYKFEWASVLSIITTDNYIFIYIDPTIGYSIPLSAFSSDEEKNHFIKYLYDHIDMYSK
ncbi:YcxB family protein [Clostridium manihotivorum]|uniref:YcxB-like C-terminal domain-containing protein n=1 Tax=Clostridium manihotivorum TaxID=2320868 RepID=A0A3R5TDT3_9CLOT|nr:YcxB family protein [Clostridium manihotivorum]QAA31104.1 hypothetical protein C1I91_05180 [Clostridium manihotivorum]